MKPTQHEALRRAGRLCARTIFGMVAAFVLSGCETAWIETADVGPTYRPANFYRSDSRLPARIKRVAVLPLTASDSDSDGSLAAGMDALEPILQSELDKCQRFEVVLVSGEKLRHLTGRTCWRADEPLPADLLDQLRSSTGCDGVIFSQLTAYQPYSPLVVGWKFSLVDCAGERKGKILWSVDEVLNSGEPGVARGARDYYAGHIRNESLSESGMILYSPRQFGQYSLTALLDTLPAR